MHAGNPGAKGGWQALFQRGASDIANSTPARGTKPMTERNILRPIMLGVLMTAAPAVLPAAAQTATPAVAQARAACAADVRTLCSGVTPGGGRIVQCLREKKDRVSDSCKAALTAAAGNR
jgi:hypothetical protein